MLRKDAKRCRHSHTQRRISKARRVGIGMPVHRCVAREAAIDGKGGEVVPDAGGRIVYATFRGVGPHMTLAFAISQSISDREDLLIALHTRL